jgi:predicted NBD/HSP70 family sugar kinase
MSRWEIHQVTHLHPNLVGSAVQRLIDVGLLAEGQATSAAGSGRPRVPLQVDSSRCNVIGVTISPGEVQLERVNLCGEAIGRPVRKSSAQAQRLIPSAAAILEEAIDRNTLAVGVSVTGVVDVPSRTLLVSSAAPALINASLEPIYRAAGACPLILDNDMHALAARWLLGHGDETEDTLLVGLDDGRIGASMLIEGKPNRGCVMAGNELGHLRLAVETDICFCGHPGCIERIFSTSQLKRYHEKSTLSELISKLPAESTALKTVLDHLAEALANVVNFMRPTRLIVASDYCANEAFVARLRQSVQQRLLAGLADRVRIEPWLQTGGQWSSSAAWLALANFFGESWQPPVEK